MNPQAYEVFVEYEVFVATIAQVFELLVVLLVKLVLYEVEVFLFVTLVKLVL